MDKYFSKRRLIDHLKLSSPCTSYGSPVFRSPQIEKTLLPNFFSHPNSPMNGLADHPLQFRGKTNNEKSRSTNYSNFTSATKYSCIGFKTQFKWRKYQPRSKQPNIANPAKTMEQTIMKIKSIKNQMYIPLLPRNTLIERATSLRNSIVNEPAYLMFATSFYPGKNNVVSKECSINAPKISFSIQEPTQGVINEWKNEKPKFKNVECNRIDLESVRKAYAPKKDKHSYAFQHKVQLLKKLIRSLRELKSLKLTVGEIFKEEIFSTKPYRREKSAEFFKLIKEGELRGICELLDRDKYLVHDTDLVGLSGLHWAVKRKFYNIASELIERNANPNARDTTGKTPLIIACANNDVQMVRLLIVNRANPFLKTTMSLVAMNATSNLMIKRLIHRTKLFHIALNFVSYRKLEEVWKNWELFILKNFN